jgi:hypothetical protein
MEPSVIVWTEGEIISLVIADEIGVELDATMARELIGALQGAIEKVEMGNQKWQR